MSTPSLDELVVAARGDLLRFVERRAGRLLRFETAEDLVQGVQLRVLDRGVGFEYRGEEAFRAWLFTSARAFLNDRRAHWTALKRRSGNLLRITQDAAGTSDPRAVNEPARRRTGPSTFASRREQLTFAVRALAVLLPRDRRLVQWHTEGLSLEEQAARLGATYAATQKAHHRALERFRKAFRLVSA